MAFASVLMTALALGVSFLIYFSAAAEACHGATDCPF
jgi:hypothetical protein